MAVLASSAFFFALLQVTVTILSSDNIYYMSNEWIKSRDFRNGVDSIIYVYFHYWHRPYNFL
jgi:hypothetical protein